VLATWLIPPDADLRLSALLGFLGGIGGLLLLFLGIYGWNLFRAPYRQRDEARALVLAKPKPIPLPNRDMLIRAIAGFADAAIEVINRQEYLDRMDAQNPNLVHAEAMINSAYQTYWEAYKKIGSEKLVATEPFGQPISDLIAFIWAQVFLKTQKPTVYTGSPLQVFTALELAGRIGSKVEETKQNIDEISGQVPGKEGSQP
jgi:hypothetical protein